MNGCDVTRKSSENPREPLGKSSETPGKKSSVNHTGNEVKTSLIAKHTIFTGIIVVIKLILVRIECLSICQNSWTIIKDWIQRPWNTDNGVLIIATTMVKVQVVVLT